MTRSDAPHLTLHHGDALDVLRTMPDASVDAVVTDPPYGLAEHKPATIATAMTAWCSGDRDHVPDGKGFMGRAWDGFVPPPAVWDECLRVLKPGGHLLCFAGTRTVDLMGISIRLAGFEMRDAITWMYGSGFPKSLDVGKAIDKAAGATREVVGTYQSPENTTGFKGQSGRGVCAADQRVDGEPRPVTAPATDAARQWQGWGTALKPASEPIIVARKPLAGTVAANVLAHGTGALNVDATRVSHASPEDLATSQAKNPGRTDVVTSEVYGAERPQQSVNTMGRWPANVILAHTPDCADPCAPGCPVAELDAQSGTTTSLGGSRGASRKRSSMGGGVLGAQPDVRPGFGDTGGASRFFPTFRYQAKAPTKERPKVDGVAHPTVKPLALMRWLVRLVCPPGGVVLDPFAGSGTTLQAARDEGMNAVGIEREATYLPLIAARLGVEVDALAPAPVEVVPDVMPLPTADDIRHDRALAELQGREYEPWPCEEAILAPAEPADPILELIAATPARRPALLAIWREHEHAWTDVHTAAVKARLTGTRA